MTLLIYYSSHQCYCIPSHIHDDDAIADCTAKYNWWKGAWEISSATKWNKRHGITCAYNTCPIELERECIKNINWIKRRKTDDDDDDDDDEVSLSIYQSTE